MWFFAALAFCPATPSQSSEVGRKPVRALGSDKISLSDFYDKASGIYFQPLNLNPPKLPAVNPSELNQRTPTIAVLDSGVMHSHPLLRDVMIVDQDFTGEGPEDRNGHGTFVTLTYLEELSMIYQGMQNVPKQRILNVKVLGKDGTGDSQDVKKGMQWAVDNGAEVLNMSLGVDQSLYPDVCELASKLIKERRIQIYAAAGNDPKFPMCPAMADGVISVGATELQAPMRPTLTASTLFTLLPVTAPSVSSQESVCDAGTWRASYLSLIGKGSLQEAGGLVKKCPATFQNSSHH
jgi:subtilisin family serine protease